MMRIDAVQIIYVQSDAGVVHQSLKKFVDQIDVELPYGSAGKFDPIFEAGATG